MKTTSILAALMTAVSLASASPLVCSGDVQLAGGPLCVANRCSHYVDDDARGQPGPELAGGPFCVANRCPYKITDEELAYAA
jgi:hypothetical protein